jgi:hypothetical protein
MEKDKILINSVYGVSPNNFDYEKMEMVQNEVKRFRMGGDRRIHCMEASPEPTSLRSMESQPFFEPIHIY